MRKQFGSFRGSRAAGEFLRFRQIFAEAKPPWIKISRKACGRCWDRFGIMFEFRAEAKLLENRIWRKPDGSLAEGIWIYFEFQRGSKRRRRIEFGGSWAEASRKISGFTLIFSAEAKPPTNRIWRKLGGSFAEASTSGSDFVM